jgi:hypothetical protein
MEIINSFKNYDVRKKEAHARFPYWRVYVDPFTDETEGVNLMFRAN